MALARVHEDNWRLNRVGRVGYLAQMMLFGVMLGGVGYVVARILF